MIGAWITTHLASTTRRWRRSPIAPPPTPAPSFDAAKNGPLMLPSPPTETTIRPSRGPTHDLGGSAMSTPRDIPLPRACGPMTPLDPEQRASLTTELHRVAKLLEHAESHLERGNRGAVVEAIEDAYRRLTALREHVGT